ncbi:hypothetical protein JB92DRAFT_62930 [Gautieria morchelliformis]|nr:hypothetical protein JB92DRAFT_62930 [Gautieria morchelliformis]
MGSPDHSVSKYMANSFIGGGVFCLKMYNPDDPNGPQLCNHIYDEIGCNFNALADYGQINGTFEVCDSDDMTPPGVFTTAPGQTTTWFQPQTGPVVPPYTTSIPASSNCQTFSSNPSLPRRRQPPPVVPPLGLGLGAEPPQQLVAAAVARRLPRQRAPAALSRSGPPWGDLQLHCSVLMA